MVDRVPQPGRELLNGQKPLVQIQPRSPKFIFMFDLNYSITILKIDADDGFKPHSFEMRSDISIAPRWEHEDIIVNATISKSDAERLYSELKMILGK